MAERNIILVAETGSDITPEMARELGVCLVPMHVAMGDETRDDGSFPAAEICRYYDKTGKVPTTSASNPSDFQKVFDEIHAAHPDKKILHLAYSAVTTCSYNNALMVSEGRDYVKSVDTKHVSVGQAVAVICVARWLDEHPDATLEQAAEAAVDLSARVQMSFLPNNLDYLRAGGRVSNATALVGNLLGLHPCIEIIDGKLMAKKKYRGVTDRLIPRVIADFAEKYDLDTDTLWLIRAPGLSAAAQNIAEKAAYKQGFRKFCWMNTGCVITCHGGAGAFGVVGVCRK